MTKSCTLTGRSARAVQWLLTALVGFALLLAAMVVEAVPASAGNRVGASTPVMINTVGSFADISPGQQLGNNDSGPEIVVATGVAAKPADDFVGPLSKAEFDGLQKALEPNKLNHLFAKQQHGLDGLVERYGSQQAVVEQMYRGLSGVTPSEGLFSVTRTMGGQAVTIDGRVVNGIPRIGTAYIKP